MKNSLVDPYYNDIFCLKRSLETISLTQNSAFDTQSINI
jgi:hypothetical protein